MKCVKTERNHKPKNRKIWTLDGKNNKSQRRWSNFHSKSAFDYFAFYILSPIIKTINNTQKAKYVPEKKTNLSKENKLLLFWKYREQFGPTEYAVLSA